MVDVAVRNKIKKITVTTAVTKIKSTNVLVTTKKNVQVSANNTIGVVYSTPPVTILNTPTLVSMGAEKISQLKDVDTSNKIQGATFVYNSANNTYVLSKLDMEYITGGLYGGTF